MPKYPSGFGLRVSLRNEKDAVIENDAVVFRTMAKEFTFLNHTKCLDIPDKVLKIGIRKADKFGEARKKILGVLMMRHIIVVGLIKFEIQR